MDFLTQDDLEDELNTVERILAGATSQDEFLSAVLHNQKLIAQAMMQSGGATDSKVGAVPDGTAGLAIDDIPAEDTGTILFKIGGRTLLKEMRADQTVNSDEVVAYSSVLEAVRPVGDVPQSKLDFGSIGFATTDAGGFERLETDADTVPEINDEGNVEIGPGEEKTLIEFEANGPTSWHEVGTKAHTFTQYQYYADDEAIFNKPLTTPLGAFNDVYRFPVPLEFRSSIEITARRSEQASGPEDYFSKITVTQ